MNKYVKSSLDLTIMTLLIAGYAYIELISILWELINFLLRLMVLVLYKRKRSQRPVIIENNYSGEYITFEGSTGEYIVEIQKMILCIQANYLYLNI